MAEKLFQLQETFGERGVDTTVDIGYHYTQEVHYEKIRENGLMTKSEREQCKIGSHTNGQVFGEGIYTANNMFAFRSYGEVYVQRIHRLFSDNNRQWHDLAIYSPNASVSYPKRFSYSTQRNSSCTTERSQQ
jgi:hypothetical protein